MQYSSHQPPGLPMCKLASCTQSLGRASHISAAQWSHGMCGCRIAQAHTFLSSQRVHWTTLVWRSPSSPGLHSATLKGIFEDVNVMSLSKLFSLPRQSLEHWPPVGAEYANHLQPQGPCTDFSLRLDLSSLCFRPDTERWIQSWKTGPGASIFNQALVRRNFTCPPTTPCRDGAPLGVILAFIQEGESSGSELTLGVLGTASVMRETSPELCLPTPNQYMYL